MRNQITTSYAMWISVLRNVNCQLSITRTVVNLSFKIIGDNHTDDKAPILLCHGFLESKKHWEGLGKVMFNTMKRSVVSVDLRNHGDSPHAHPHGYEEMAADILKLYNKLAVDKACLIGYNMGGKASMCLSLIAPQKVAALIIVEVSPVSTPPIFKETMSTILAAMKMVEFKNSKTVNEARKRAKEQLKEVIHEESVMKIVLSNINIKADNIIGWTCNLDLLIKHVDNISSFPKNMKGKRYRGPTLFIGGQGSDFIPPDDLTKIRSYFPQAVIQYIPNAGHDIQNEDPKAFLELVITFLKNTV